jgi:hypothetical protein
MTKRPTREEGACERWAVRVPGKRPGATLNVMPSGLVRNDIKSRYQVTVYIDQKKCARLTERRKLCHKMFDHLTFAPLNFPGFDAITSPHPFKRVKSEVVEHFFW